MAVDDLDRFKQWRHHIICESLPGNAWGTGGIGLADFTGNGILDVAVSRRQTKTAYWFELRPDGSWRQHVIGTSEHLARTLGAVAVDVDHDGFVDMVFSGVWFRNPGNLAEEPDTPWEPHEFDGGGHDIIAADINGDGFADIVTFDGKVLAWFDTSNGLAKTVIADDLDVHGGVAPHGFGDISGKGLVDLVVPDFWFENPGDGYGEWKRHPWPHTPVPNASYGVCIRVWVADMNGTGHNDIVYTNSDTGFCHLYWVENLGGGRKWKSRRLPDPPGNKGTGSFHSLGVADFDRDGNLEIFVGEQEEASRSVFIEKGLKPMKPEGLKERGIIWANSGGKNPRFEPVVFHEGRPGWHDAVLGDVTGNGRIDIVSKVWNTDWNEDGRNYHVDFWENMIGE